MKLKVIPLGGLGEIGLNCMVLEWGEEILVLDCGVMFSDLQMLGVDFVIPDMTYLKDNKHKIKGYVITHAHEDHIGALPFALKSHPAPIFSSMFARKLIEAKLVEHGLDKSTDFRPLTPGVPVKFHHFTVTAVPVNHSIIEALALIIDTPVGKIVFTGDFKIDSNPFYGKPLNPVPFQNAGREGVLLLMSDSTNVEREGHSVSESSIYGKFEELFQKSKGLTVVAVFASNIARVGQVVELAHKLGKKIVLLGRSMDQNVRTAFEMGYLEKLNDVLISVEDAERFPRSSVIVLSTGSQGEYRSALVRIANAEHRSLRLGVNDTVILSSKFIPGNEKAIGRMINSLFRIGADVLYESIADIHVSGHANAGELRAMINMTQPKFFLPVHGEYRHLVKHARLARATGVKEPNVVIAENGDVLELTRDSFEKTGRFEENRVLIEGQGGRDVSKVILKDRRKVAETGIVFSVLIRNSVSGQIMGGPDLISRGFMDEDSSSELFTKAKKIILGIIEDAARSRKENDLQEEIRVALRRYFFSRVGKKPVVLPIIVDV